MAQAEAFARRLDQISPYFEVRAKTPLLYFL
jgi:hypothetical protein